LRDLFGRATVVKHRMSNDYANLKNVCLLVACSFLSISCGVLSGEEDLPSPKPLLPDDPKGTALPAGVPRMVDANGNVVSINHGFTTPQYERAAAQLLLQEANGAAEQLRLPDEVLPITKSNVTELHVAPFGYSYIYKTIGVIGTSNYVYLVSKGDKLSGLGVAGYDQACLSLEKISLSLEQMDTNAAYELATQWLTSVSMDVNGLNRDCKAHVAVSPYWNGLSRIGQVPKKNFVPIYSVWWTSPRNDAEGYGDVAYVELFLPAKKLLQLSIDDPKYILRKPLVFTNLDSLFPGTGQVSVLPKESGSGSHSAHPTPARPAPTR
jgi:hypothetical protein